MVKTETEKQKCDRAETIKRADLGATSEEKGIDSNRTWFGVRGTRREVGCTAGRGRLGSQAQVPGTPSKWRSEYLPSCWLGGYHKHHQWKGSNSGNKNPGSIRDARATDAPSVTKHRGMLADAQTAAVFIEKQKPAMKRTWDFVFRLCISSIFSSMFCAIAWFCGLLFPSSTTMYSVITVSFAT